MQKTKGPKFDDISKIMVSLDKKKISKPVMTIYEFNKLIGCRANQLALGAQPFISVPHLDIKSNMELRQIAIEELKQGKLPYIIERPLPNNKFEHFRVSDLDLVSVQYMMR